MKTLDLVQGSPEWHAHRAAHFNASDAPAMMGCSPYKTRTQLLQELKSGIVAEVDAATQRRFDDGHRFEALARPLAETIVGESLYPVVGTSGELSASFDGLSMAEDIGFEHKSLNDQLRAALMSDAGADALPLAYRVQMEQQLLVAGADRILFMASKWDGDQLVEEMHAWYEPDLDLRAKIIAGWRQFATDLATFQLETAAPAAPTGRAPDALPALHIVLKGEVSASNLAEFKDVALTAIRSVNRDLKTDQDFADSAKARKWCSDIEDRVKAAKDHALSQTATIDMLFRTMDEVSAEAREVRLALEKLEKTRGELRRGEIVAGGIAGLRDHVASLNARFGRALMPAIPADFAGAIKGKKSFDSMKDAVATTLANAKIEASAIADKITANSNAIDAHPEHAHLFPDVATLVLKASDDLAAVITARIAEAAAAEERRKVAEEAARVVVEPAPAPSPAPAPAVVQMPARAAAAPTAAPTLSLGQIGTRLGFSLTADFLRQLGFEPAGRARAAVLYHEATFPHLCAALVEHVQSIQARQSA